MKRLLQNLTLVALAALVSVATTSALAGQDQPANRGAGAAPAPAGQGRGRGAPPPPAAQAGHPSGKLVIWGDIANFDRPPSPAHCTLMNRFKRGQRVGFRMTAVDGGTGEVENTAVLTAHVTSGGRTTDVPMRWRGNIPYPQDEYPRNPAEMWTGVWTVPDDATVGTVTYTVTATDRFGRTATFSPFPNIVAQLAVVE